jgi:2,4-didehydro-3-deoxy-L-rhamnonate hydrolase
MKLLTFQTGNEAHVGVALTDRIIDLTRALRFTHPGLRCSDSLLAIIQAGIDIDQIGAESIERLRQARKEADCTVAAPKWLPPIPRPPKILALALNSRGHLEESKLNFFDEPIVFAKYACNLVAHEGDIELPPFPQVVDEEHELALVVSRDCRHLRPSQARDYIFGYTIATTFPRATGNASGSRWDSPTATRRISRAFARWAHGLLPAGNFRTPAT